MFSFKKSFVRFFQSLKPIGNTPPNAPHRTTQNRKKRTLHGLERLETRETPAGLGFHAILQLPESPIPNTSGILPAVTLPVETYVFGFHTPTTIASGRVTPAKTQFDALEVVAGLNAATTAAADSLFAALTKGAIYPTGVLTQYGADGTPVVAWVLGTVRVTNDTISLDNDVPFIDVKLAFASVTEATQAHRASYDVSTAKAVGPALPADLVLSALPPPANTPITLELSGGNVGQSAPPIRVQDYTFGFKNPVVIGSALAGASVGRPTFDALTVTATFGASSPLLFGNVNPGRSFKTATLIQRDSAGRTVAAWALGNVFVTTNAISSSDEMPQEQLKFVFGSITETTKSPPILGHPEVKVISASWDQLKNVPTGPELPANLTLDLLTSTSTDNKVFMQLFPTNYSQGASRILPINSINFGLRKSLSIASGGSGGNVDFDPLEVHLSYNETSPSLRGNLFAGTHYKALTIVQLDATRKVIARWDLGNVSLSEAYVAGQGIDLPLETLKFDYAEIKQELLVNGNRAISTWNHVKNQPDLDITFPDFEDIVPIVQVAASNAISAGASAPAASPPAPSIPTTLRTRSASLSAAGGGSNLSGNVIVYDGQPHPAVALATGLDGSELPGTITFTYYQGTAATGPGTSDPPVEVGTYTVVAHFVSDDPLYTNVDTAPFTFTIVPAGPAENCPPTIQVPGPQIVQPDTAAFQQGLLFSPGNGNAITIGDIDAGNGSLTVQLSVQHGRLAQAVTYAQVVGYNSANLTITGTLAEINQTLASLYYVPTLGYTGTDSLSINVDDQGNTGAGGSKTATASVTIRVQDQANHAPTVQVPTAQFVQAFTPFALNDALGNGIRVGDVDAGFGLVQVTISVQHGLLSLPTLTEGVTVLNGAHLNTPTIILLGRVDHLNYDLQSLTYMATENALVSDAIVVRINDLGNTGSGGALTAVASVPVLIQPSIIVLPSFLGIQSPTTQTVSASSHLLFSLANGNAIQVHFPNVGPDISIELKATRGRFAVAIAEATVTGAQTNNMTITGTPAQVNRTLDTLFYISDSTNGGDDTIELNATTDTLIASATITVPVQDRANIAPNITPPVGPISTPVFAPTVLSDLQVGDLDAGVGVVQLTLSVQHGVLSLPSLVGLTVLGGFSTGTPTLTVSGRIDHLNYNLRSLTYTATDPSANSDVLSMTINDLGNTGTGGPLSATSSVEIAITPSSSLAVPLSVGGPTLQTVTPNGALQFSAANGNAIRIADPAAADKLTVQLSVTSGFLNVAIALCKVTGQGTQTLTLVGTPAEINQTLDTLFYLSQGSTGQTDTISITARSFVGSTSGSVQIRKEAHLNVAPRVILPTSPQRVQATSHAFSDANGNSIRVGDLDAGLSDVQVTIRVEAGTVSVLPLVGISTAPNREVPSITGVGTASITLIGRVDHINYILQSLVYTPLAGKTKDQLWVRIDDLGNIGTPGPLSAAGGIELTPEVLQIVDWP